MCECVVVLLGGPAAEVVCVPAVNVDVHVCFGDCVEVMSVAEREGVE